MRPIQFRDFDETRCKPLRGLARKPDQRVAAGRERAGLHPFLTAAGVGLCLWALILSPFIL